MNFPIIIVERPHQIKGQAWIAEGESDILNQLAEGNYGDNWGWAILQSRHDVYEIFGVDQDDWPNDLQLCEFPAVLMTTPSGVELTPVDETGGEIDFALEYMAHDLYAMDVCTMDEARELAAKGGHNMPVDDIHECLEYLEDE